MDKDLVIKNMREAIEINKTVREKTNNALSAGIGLLEKHDGEYERGLKDCVNAVKKIMRLAPSGERYLSIDDLEAIFGTFSWQDIIRDNTPQELISKIEAYEKRKEEDEAEKNKIKLGDVVVVKYCDPRIDFYFIVKGIYIKDTGTTHNVLIQNGEVYVIEKDRVESVRKTGEHVDILGVLEKEN